MSYDRHLAVNENLADDANPVPVILLCCCCVFEVGFCSRRK